MARECEIKVRLDRTLRQHVEQRLDTLGLRPGDHRTELDYAPDTPDGRLKAAGLLLRFRRIRRAGRPDQALVTVKAARPAAGFQDNDEYEYRADLPAERAPGFAVIAALVRDRAGLDLPAGLAAADTLPEWSATLADTFGMTAVRACVEKSRTVRRGLGGEICVDRFPQPLGTWLELETSSPDTLRAAITALDLDTAPQDPRPYARILAALSPVATRTCLTPATFRELAPVLRLSPAV